MHALHCHAVGSSSLKSCSTSRGVWTRFGLITCPNSPWCTRQTLASWVAGATHCTSATLCRAPLLRNISISLEKSKKKARVAVRQAPALLHSHLQAIIGPMRQRLRISPDPFERAVLARNVALLTAAFNTTKRGDELTHTLIQRILRLPSDSGLLFKFQLGNTMRCGADHLISVAYEEVHIATCPGTAVEEFVSIGLGWDMESGYLFPVVFKRKSDWNLIRRASPISASSMTKSLQANACNADKRSHLPCTFSG